LSQLLNLIEEDRDRFSRMGTLYIGNKITNIPGFIPRIRTKEELDIFINLASLYPQKYIKGFLIRFSDKPDIILPSQSKLSQMNLNMESFAFEGYKKILSEYICVIDPSCEYLLYEGNNEAYKLLSLFKKNKGRKNKFDYFIKYLNRRISAKKELTSNSYRNWKKREYKRLWYNFDRNISLMGRMIGEIQDLESKYKSDILIPCVPIIYNETMLDISININRISNAIADKNKNSATYLILNGTGLNNDNIIEKLQNFLLKDPSKITIMKLKNVDLNNSSMLLQREYYNEIMSTIINIIEDNNNKTYMLLDGGNQTFPSLISGFDIASTSMIGLDGDVVGSFGTTPYGRWFYKNKLITLPRKKIIDMYDNNNNMLCSCPACVDISRVGPRNVSPDKWNILRREHYIFKMNELMSDITNSIKRREIELMRQFLLQSELSRLAMLVPRN